MIQFDFGPDMSPGRVDLPGTSSNQYFSMMPSMPSLNMMPDNPGDPGDFGGGGGGFGFPTDPSLPTFSGGGATATATVPGVVPQRTAPFTGVQGGYLGPNTPGLIGQKDNLYGVPTLDAAFTGDLFGFLQSMIGKGTSPFDLSTNLPSGGSTTAGSLTAGSNPLIQMLQNFFSGKGGGMPGMDILSAITQGGGPGGNTLSALAQGQGPGMDILSQIARTGMPTGVVGPTPGPQGAVVGPTQASPSGVVGPTPGMKGSVVGPTGSGGSTDPTGSPIDQTAAWQAMVDSMKRNTDMNATNLKEQFNFTGNLASSPMGNSMSDFFSQTAKDQNAQLLAAQTAALENAANRKFSAGESAAGRTFTGAESFANRDLTSVLQAIQDQFSGSESFAGRSLTSGLNTSNQDFSGRESFANRDLTSMLQALQNQFSGQESFAGRSLTAGTNAADRSLQAATTLPGIAGGAASTQLPAASQAGQFLSSTGTNFGQYLQGLDQSSITNLLNEFIRTSPEYNPLIGNQSSLASIFPPIISGKTGTGIVGNLLQALPGAAGAGIAAGTAQGGGALAGLIAALGALCWIADEIYGPNDIRTHLVRHYINGPVASTPDGKKFVERYKLFGAAVASRVRTSPKIKQLVKPKFDALAMLALKDIYNVYTPRAI